MLSGVVLQGLGLYQYLVDFAGAGATVPISGFGYLLANGAIQFRISEALCILPIFLPEAVPGLFIGCLISNLITAGNPFDIVFGALATLIGAYGAWLLRKLPHKLLWLATIPTVLANMLIVPPVLIFAYGVEDAYLWLVLTVGIGEVVCAAIGGTILGYALKKAKIDKFC